MTLIQAFAQLGLLMRESAFAEPVGIAETNPLLLQIRDFLATETGPLTRVYNLRRENDTAGLQAAIKRRLSRERNLFGTVGNNTAASQLATAGNQIDVNASRQVAQQAGRALSVFDQLKNRSGEISRILNEAATSIQEGADKRRTETQAYRQILDAIQSGNFEEGTWN